MIKRKAFPGKKVRFLFDILRVRGHVVEIFAWAKKLLLVRVAGIVANLVGDAEVFATFFADVFVVDDHPALDAFRAGARYLAALGMAAADSRPLRIAIARSVRRFPSRDGSTARAEPAEHGPDSAVTSLPP